MNTPVTPLTDMTMAQLVSTYNDMVDVPVKGFRNKAQGIASIQEILDAAAISEAAEYPDDSWMAAMNPADDDEPAPSGELSSLVGQLTGETPPAATEPAPASNLVSLQALCDELKVVPRIARRRLRKAMGTLIEGRWEFAPEQLDEARRIISATAKAE